MAIAFVAAGTWTAGTTSIAPPLPAGMAAGHLMLLAIHTPNKDVTAVTNWTQVTGSPVSTGTAAAAGGTRITLYYRFWQSGDTAPTVAVTSGNNTQARIFGFSGVNPTTPFDATPVATTLAAASTTLTMTGITTATDNACIFWAVARDVDAASTTGVTAFVNANLTGITERNDQTVTTGVGGGLWVGNGFKATAGATGNLVITQTSSIAVGLTVALRPALNNYTLTGLGGSYTLTGGSAVLKRNLTLTASGGSYALAGGTATITWAVGANAYTLIALGGNYSLTGASATISRNRRLTSTGGTYNLTGASATLLRSKRLVASGGAYIINGGSAIITYVAGAVAYTLTCNGGSYSLTGSSANLARNRVLTSSGGSYNITGTNANINRNRSLSASGGAYTVNGASSVILRSKLLTAQGGSYGLNGGTATLLRNKKLIVTGGTYTYTGSSAVITKAGSGTITWPPENSVLLGVNYGPTGSEYVGTLDALTKSIKLDISTGALVIPLNDKVVMSL